MKLKPEALEGQLERRLLPAWLVSGDEPLVVSEAADAIRARARAAGFTEREVHFIERAGDWETVRAAGGTLSLFGSRRVLELRLSSGRPGVAGNGALCSLLERADPDTVLLVIAPRLEREAQSAEWVRRLEADGAFVQVWPVGPDRIAGWIAARARRLGLELTPGAVGLLAGRTEGNLLAADQELRKLVLLAPEGKLDEVALLGTVADSARFDVFKLTDAALAGDAGRALRVLGGLEAEGTEPTLVLWALVRALRDLWSAASAHGGGGGGGRWRGGAPDAGRSAAGRRLPWTRLAARAAMADRIAKGRERGDAWEELALLTAGLCALAPLPDAPGMLK